MINIKKEDIEKSNSWPFVEAKKILKEIQPGDIEKTYANTSSLFEWVGYKPKVNIEIGIKNFVDWFLKYYS